MATLHIRVLSSSIWLLLFLPFATAQDSGQDNSAQPMRTWQALGFQQLSKDFSNDQIPLFQGLNAARGTWSMKAEVRTEQDPKQMKGTLLVQGHPQAGMIPMWYLNWQADSSEKVTSYVLMAGPDKNRFKLSLVRIGPALRKTKDKASIPRALFEGKWNQEQSTISWVERAPPTLAGTEPVQRDVVSEQRDESFEMAIRTNGRITFLNAKNPPNEVFVRAETVEKTEEAPKEPTLLAGKHSFKTLSEIDDPRIEPWIPKQATEISLVCNRGGHLARYKIQELQFLKFVDSLWGKSDASAHKRSEMSGEGEPVSSDEVARRFKRAGWAPLENATTYYGPSQSNGAITTYYFDREAGVVYHDRGYW